MIIPVYNRPEELRALLTSISEQQSGMDSEEIGPGDQADDAGTPALNAEIIVVDDGSDAPLASRIERIVRNLKPQLPVPLRLLSQENAGPGLARNYGARAAKGQWLLFLDSDCELPVTYFQEVEASVQRAEEKNSVLMGGPDSARRDYSPLQQAIQYAMSSVLTTGGIRGRKKAADTYYPRSFNMLVKASAFHEVSGFANLRFGEDLDLSMRIMEAGGKSSYMPTLAVYHKRRSTLKAFFKQVFNSGMARIVLHKRHPGSLRAVHILPSLFTIVALLTPVLLTKPVLFFAFWGSFSFILGLHSLASTGNLKVGALSVPAAAVQLGGYGSGFLYAAYLFLVLQRPERYAFRQTFYN